MERELSYAFNLPPEKALEYFRNKGLAITEKWYELWQEAHTRAFTVAKISQAQLLLDVKELVDKAIEKGLTIKDFQKEFYDMIEKKGWVVPSQVAHPWRLETIYRTNLQTAYMKGRYHYQMQDKTRPYWMYVAVLDNATRPSHRAMNEKIFPKDHPIWDVWYPPNGFNCRCRVRALTEEEAQARGGVSQGHLIWKTESLHKTDPSSPKVKVGGFIDENGNVAYTDKGFSYNPAKAYENWVNQTLQTLPPQLKTSVQKDIEAFKEKNTIEVSLYEVLKQAKEGKPLKNVVDRFDSHLRKRAKEGVASTEEEFRQLILDTIKNHEFIVVEKRKDFTSVSYVGKVKGDYYVVVARKGKIVTAYKIKKSLDEWVSGREFRLEAKQIKDYIFLYALSNLGLIEWIKN